MTFRVLHLVVKKYLFSIIFQKNSADKPERKTLADYIIGAEGRKVSCF
jgi:hypothetical protein